MTTNLVAQPTLWPVDLDASLPLRQLYRRIMHDTADNPLMDGVWTPLVLARLNQLSQATPNCSCSWADMRYCEAHYQWVS